MFLPVCAGLLTKYLMKLSGLFLDAELKLSTLATFNNVMYLTSGGHTVPLNS